MTRKHELFLINLGLETLLERMTIKKEKKAKKSKGKGWSKKQHEKYAATMEKKWGQKRKK